MRGTEKQPKCGSLQQAGVIVVHEIQQIISTLGREDKIPSAALVSRLHNEKKLVILKPLNKNSFEEIYQTKGLSNNTLCIRLNKLKSDVKASEE